MTPALLGTVLVMAAMTGYSTSQRTTWASARGIHALGPWAVLVATQWGTGLAAAAYIYPTWGTGAAISAASFAWFGILAMATDIKSYRIPFEVPLYLVAPVGLVAFAFNYTFEGMLSFVSAALGLVIVPLVARALTNSGLGASDVRLLWAVVATCSWWVGQNWLIYAILAACFLQIAVRIIAPKARLGRMVPVREGAERLRRELPFAPALIISFFGAIIYGTTTGYGACLMWNVLGTCA
jgi:prepilin signal peptidase PulO-like enzyme (type II secretory pathway)